MPKIRMGKNREELASKRNIGILVLLIIAGAALYFGLADREKAPLAEGCLPLYGTGKQTYDILTDKPNKPQIMQVSVDPIDVKEGQEQKIMVMVQEDGADTITQKNGVVATITTDNGKAKANPFVLRRGEDSQDGSSLLTTWEGSWLREDSVCRTYMETITATNSTGEKHVVDLSFK